MKSFLLKPEQKNLNDVSVTINIMVKVLQKKGTLNWELLTGNRKQIRNTHLHQFRASVKKKMFLKDA